MSMVAAGSRVSFIGGNQSQVVISSRSSVKVPGT